MQFDSGPRWLKSGNAEPANLLDQRGPIAYLMIRATCSSRQAEPRRVRSAFRLRAAAIPRIVRPLWRK